MNLLQLRQQFRTLSGRHDLVDAAGADTGAGFFINAAQKHLDRLDETQKSWGICYRFCEIGRYAVSFPYCRAVKEIWAATVTARWQLKKKNLQDLITEYLTAPCAGVGYGTILKSGATTGAAAGKLIDSGGGLSAILVGAVARDSSGNYAYVTAIDSDTQLSISSSIFSSGESYTIFATLSGVLTPSRTGNSLYYAPTITRYIPEDLAAADFEAFVGYVDVMSGDHYAYNTIIISPPTSEKLMIEVRGLFYTRELTNDTDKTYWSEVHPNVLIMATLREIEIINRNTQGVNDWDNAIAAAVSGIGKDLVEELIAEVTQIGD